MTECSLIAWLPSTFSTLEGTPRGVAYHVWTQNTFETECFKNWYIDIFSSLFLIEICIEYVWNVTCCLGSPFKAFSLLLKKTLSLARKYRGLCSSLCSLLQTVIVLNGNPIAQRQVTVLIVLIPSLSESDDLSQPLAAHLDVEVRPFDIKDWHARF